MTTVGLMIYTRRFERGPLLAMLHRTGICDAANNMEPFPDAGRWRPSCIGDLADGERVHAALWRLADQRFRWGFAGPSGEYKEIAPEAHGLWMWGILLPFTELKRFRLPISSGGVGFFTRQELKNSVLEVHCTQQEGGFDWAATSGMSKYERHRALQGFDLFS